MIVVHIDGLCKPTNPGGTATFGYVIRDNDGSVLDRRSGIVGPTVSLEEKPRKFRYRSERRLRARYESDERQVEIPEGPVPREVSRSNASPRSVH